MAQTRWMLDLLLLMVPDHSEDKNHKEQEHHYTANISLQTLNEDAKMLAEKLDFFSMYISRYQKFLPVFTIHNLNSVVLLN